MPIQATQAPPLSSYNLCNSLLRALTVRSGKISSEIHMSDAASAVTPTLHRSYASSIAWEASGEAPSSLHRAVGRPPDRRKIHQIQLQLQSF